MRESFFARAASDLEKYKPWLSQGQAEWAVNRIKSVIATKDALKLGQAYFEALFYLNKTGSGPELVRLILFTLEDIKSGVVDAENFHFNPEALPFKLEVMKAVSDGLSEYFKSRDDKANEIIKILGQMRTQINPLSGDIQRLLNLIQNMNTSIIDSVNKNNNNLNTVAVEIKEAFSRLEGSILSSSSKLSQQSLKEMKGYIDSINGLLKTFVSNTELKSTKMIEEMTNIQKGVTHLQSKIKTMDSIMAAARELKNSMSRNQWIILGAGILITFAITAFVFHRLGRNVGRNEYSNSVSPGTNQQNDNQNTGNVSRSWLSCNLF